MNRTEFLQFNDTPCKFKLRGGREIFGVIWENTYGNELIHFFSTTAERMRYKIAEQRNDRLALERLKTPVELEDVVLAEPLS
jgi:hypothetical protein